MPLSLNKQQDKHALALKLYIPLTRATGVDNLNEGIELM